MLVAIDANNVRYLSIDTTTIHREKGFYLCQECKQPIFLRLCLNKVSHFAHYPEVKCAGAWEPDTETHSVMKKDVYDYFKKFSWVQKIEIEHPIDIKGKIYIPDIYIETTNNHKIAVECQAHRATSDAILQRVLTYAEGDLLTLFIFEKGEFMRDFVDPRDGLYASPIFEENPSEFKDLLLQRYYVYDPNRGPLIYSTDVEFVIPVHTLAGTHVETYETKTDFSSYKINIAKIRYHAKDGFAIKEIPMVVDMEIPKFNFEKIEKLRQEEELRERLRHQALDQKKEDELKRNRENREDELQRKKAEEIQKRRDLGLSKLKEKLELIDIDEPWALYAALPGGENVLLPPLSWKGGDQVSNMKAMMTFFKKFFIPEKTKIMIYKSFPGSGKSASLLHVIRGMGRGIIVTPFKALQRQYYDDYFKGNKFVMKKDGSKLKVAVLLGRGNFGCKWLAEKYDYQQRLIEESKKPENAGIFFDIDESILNMYRYDKSCANRMLPCTAPLKINRRGGREPRWMAASTCPYWVSTPLPKQTIDQWERKVIDEEKDIDEQYDDNIGNEGENIPDIEQNMPSVGKAKTRLDSIKERLKCSEIKYYDSVSWGQVGVFIRDEIDKDGKPCPDVCQYYRQFYGYIDADVIVMNSAKWHLETRIGRKPLTDIEVFDEGDNFLDNQASEIEFQRSTIDRIIPFDNNVKRMKSAALSIFDISFKDIKTKVERQKKAVNNDRVDIIDTKSYKELFSVMLGILTDIAKRLEDDEKIEEKLIDINTIIRYIDKASISYIEGRREETKILKIYIPYPNDILRDLFNLSSKNIIMASGTVHNSYVLSNLFGINADNYTVEFLNGRTRNPGRLICIRHKTDEMPPVKVTHATWQSPQFVEYYNRYLNSALDKLKEVIDKAVGKNGEGKIIVLTPAKKYAKGIINRPDVFVDFAKKNDEDDISIKISTTLSDYVDKTLEDIRKIKENDINIDGDVLRTDKRIIVSTRMARGSDLRDNNCRGLVILKWPYPDISAGYNQALKKRFGNAIFDKIMSDKAEREAIQMVCRGLRHDTDWEYFTSPDDMAYSNVYRLFSYDK